jgi:malonyl-CoA decarboxylase
MNAPAWLQRNVFKLLPTERYTPNALTVAQEPAQTAIAIDEKVLQSETIRSATSNSAGVSSQGLRSTRERLSGTLRHKKEALSPRELRRALSSMKAIVDSQISEVEGGRRAGDLALWYASATPAQRRDCWLLMSEQFAPDPKKVEAARRQYNDAQNTPDEGAAEIGLRRALVSPRTRLLQRFAVSSGGMPFLVQLRCDLLPHLKSEKRLLALDAELENLFATWFDIAFLELRRISWDSPASLIEKLIKYEAVHDIRDWNDVKNRLDSDRRCYGFFHPQLVNEPLIFVEVALLHELPQAILPLLDESAAAEDLSKATTAIFYSISNTQPGLRGVSFGDSLIKRVVETLKAEFPRLKTFATLSPIPGLRPWLSKNADAILEKLDAKARISLEQSVGTEAITAPELLAAFDKSLALDAKSPMGHMLMQFAAHYLTSVTVDGKPVDPVARFHLGNGARIERLNWGGDHSTKGIKQSFALMVNYVYDLNRLDKYRTGFVNGKVAASKDILLLKF